MAEKHPFKDAGSLQIIRHANGTTIGTGYDYGKDRVQAVSEVHVFTTFEQMCEFLRGWWPEAK